MDAKEVAFQIAKVDRMLERVDKVCGRERDPKPLRPDVSYPRSRRSRHVAKSPLQSSAVASGQLSGNEMRVWSGYTPRPQNEDCDPDGMWAAFESDFDDMVAGMH